MKKLLPLLTLSLLVAVPANAVAAQMGGGAAVGPPSATNRGVFEQIWFKTPRSRPGRMDVGMEVDNLRCDAPAFGAPANAPVTTGVNSFENVQVKRDGSFSATFVLDQTAPTGEKSKGRSTLKGKIEDGHASGTIKAFIDVTDENGNAKTRCELDRTRWFASSERANGDRVAKPDARRYYGVNGTRASSGTRLNTVVNLNRARKKGAVVIGYNARCTEDPNNPFFGGADYSPVFSIEDGKFSVNETYSFGDPSGAGFAGRITTRYSGAFTEGGVKGKLRIRATLFQDGQEIDRCDTGKVKWWAVQS
jgi:hypothetical protein